MSGEIVWGIDFDRRVYGDAFEQKMDAVAIEMMRQDDMVHPRPDAIVDYETFLALRLRKMVAPDNSPRAAVQTPCDCSS